MNWSPEGERMGIGQTVHTGLPLLLMVYFYLLRARVWDSALGGSPVDTCRINEVDAVPRKWLQYPCN